MAAPVPLFAGFESSHEYEVSVTAGSVSVGTTPAPPSSNESYSLKLIGGGTTTRVEPFQQAQNFTGSNVVFGFYFRVEDATPAADVLFLEHIGTNGKMNMQLNYTTTGTIDALDRRNVVVASSTTTLASNTWHLIELEYTPSATGDLEIFLDGVSILTATGAEFEKDGQTTSQLVFIGSTAVQECFVASYYLLQDTVAMPTRLGDYEVLIYAYDEATATPNISGGVTLDNSTTWAMSGEKAGNDTNVSSYTGAGDLGKVETSYGAGSYTAGPKGDGRVGTIIGASWLFRYALVGLGPSGTLYYGSGDGTDGTSSIPSPTGTQHMVFDNGTVAPTSSQYFQYGMKLTTGTRFDLREVWCNLLQQPAAVTTVTPSVLTVPVTVQAPVIVTSQTVAPSALAVPVATVAPAVVVGGVTTAASPVAVPVTVVAPSVVKGAATAAPAAIAVPVSVQAPTVAVGGVVVSAATVSVVATLPAPAVVAGGLTVTPGSMAVPVVGVAPSVAVGGVAVAPAVVQVPVSVVAPTIVASGGPQVETPAALSVPVGVVAPAVVVGGVVRSPAVVVVPVGVVAPSVALGAVSVTPVAASVNVTLVSPTVVMGAVARVAGVVTVPVTVVAPIVVQSGAPQTATPSTVSVPVSVVAPAVVAGGVSAAAGTVGLPVVVVAPSVVVGGVTSVQGVLSIVVSVVAPSVGGTTVATPGKVTIPVTALGATLAPGGVVTTVSGVQVPFSVLAPAGLVGAVVRTNAVVPVTVSVVPPSTLGGGQAIAASPLEVPISVLSPVIQSGAGVYYYRLVRQRRRRS